MWERSRWGNGSYCQHGQHADQGNPKDPAVNTAGSFVAVGEALSYSYVSLTSTSMPPTKNVMSLWFMNRSESPMSA